MYEQTGAMVHRLMLRMVGQQDAVDLTQQVFLQVFRKIHQFSGKSEFATWLYRVCFVAARCDNVTWRRTSASVLRRSRS
ncbi:RNA polymerase sigma factor [Planctomycetota bacterium]